MKLRFWDKYARPLIKNIVRGCHWPTPPQYTQTEIWRITAILSTRKCLHSWTSQSWQDQVNLCTAKNLIKNNPLCRFLDRNVDNYYREAGLFGTCGAIRDGLQNIVCVECWITILNSEANLRFSTSTKSQIAVAVHDSHSAVNTQHDS